MLFDLSKSLSKNLKLINETNQFEDILPVSVEKSQWASIETSHDTYLYKQYIFSNKKHIMYFLNECFNVTNQQGIEQPIITIIDNNVEVKIMADFLNEYSDLNLRLSKHLDEIYDDIRYI